MGRSRELAALLLLQGVGSIATLACTMVLAKIDGPQVQGLFNTLKAEMDMLAAVLVLGLPQALFFYLQRGSLTWSTASRIAMAQASLGCILSAGYWWWASPAGIDLQGSRALLAASICSLAVGASILQVNSRSGVLALRSTFLFGFVTALPGAMLLLVLLVGLASGRALSRGILFPAIFCVAYGLACLLSVWIAAHAPARAGSSTKQVPLRELLSYGAATCVPAVLQTLSIVLVLRFIRASSGDAEAVGVFAAALLCLTIGLTPLNFAVPLLFKRWVVEPEGKRTQALYASYRLVIPVSIVATFLIWLLERPLVSLAFGDEYLAYGSVFALASISLLPQALGKLAGVLFNSIGRPALAIPPEAIRVLVLFLGLILWSGKSLIALTAVWILSDMAGAIAGLLIVRWQGA
jgi:O-antigen/teichoic acid export membrane protein